MALVCERSHTVEPLRRLASERTRYEPLLVGLAEMLALVVLSVSLAPFASRQAPKPSRRGCPQAGIAAHGVAGAVAYTCVSTAWYSAGVALALRGLPPPAARPELASKPPGCLLRLALGRVAKAYALAFEREEPRLVVRVVPLQSTNLTVR